jgi:hypothetical protein
MKYTLLLGHNINDRFLEFNPSTPKYFTVEKVFKDFKIPYPFNLPDLQLEQYVGSKQNTFLPQNRINTIGVRSISVVGHRKGFGLENHIIPLIVIILIMILIIKH